MTCLLQINCFIFRSPPSGRLPDWISEKFDNTEQLQRDFKRAFSNGINQYHDVFFTVGM